MSPRLLRRGRALWALALSSCAAIACDGELRGPSGAAAAIEDVSDGGDKGGGGSDGDGGVDEAPLVEPLAPHIRRLTEAQYHNTMREVFGASIASGDALPSFGDDIPTIGLNNNPAKLRVNEINVGRLYDSIERLAERAIERDDALSACAEGEGEACFEALLDRYGPALWRRPLAPEERADMLAARAALAQRSVSRPEQVEFMLRALIASPNTLYRRELGGAEGKLDDYELASALSYTLWDAPPDEELYRAAAAGELTDPEARRAQAERMLGDERAAWALAGFFLDYLKIDALAEVNKLDELGLTGGARASLAEGMERDLVAIFSDPQASLLDPFGIEAFHVNAQGASFFGVPVTSEGEFEVIAIDPSERRGVLSHPAFLSVHAGEGGSGIVKRGVFTLEQLLCVRLGAPPADISEADEVPEGFDDARSTTREVLSVRHSSQANCVGCHRSIDPAGFGYENYDAVGRWRLFEKEEVAIDASGELRVGAETLRFDDSVSYLRALSESEALRSCLSSTYFTYALGAAPRRAEREAVYAAFDASDGSVRALIGAIVTTPSFAVRADAQGEK